VAIARKRYGDDLAWARVHQEADRHAQIEAVTRKLLNWISRTGTTPGKKRNRLLLLYDYLDQLGLSEEVEQVNYYGSAYQLSSRQKLLRATHQKGSTEELIKRLLVFGQGGIACAFARFAPP